MNMRKSIIDFNEKKGFICDMDGVIYHGNQILPGVPDPRNGIQRHGEPDPEPRLLVNNQDHYRI